MSFRIRSIHHDAFKSRKLARTSPEGERMYWRLQCLCDDDGRAEDDPEVIAGQVFPLHREVEAEHVDKWLTELADNRLIIRYERDDIRCIQIVQFTKYQHPRRPQSSKLPAPPRKA